MSEYEVEFGIIKKNTVLRLPRKLHHFMIDSHLIKYFYF